jgi:hypothetical protein
MVIVLVPVLPLASRTVIVITLSPPAAGVPGTNGGPTTGATAGATVAEQVFPPVKGMSYPVPAAFFTGVPGFRKLLSLLNT